MKLRVRLQNSTKTVDLGDGGARDITFAVLRQRIKAEFRLEISFNLSLNKKDILDGDDTVLDEFGIVPGDLIHVIIEDEAQAAVEVPAVSSNPGADTEHNLEYHTSGTGTKVAESSGASNFNMETGVYPSTSASADHPLNENFDQRPPVDDPVVNRCLREPMQCYESTDTAVPAVLSQLYESVTSRDQQDVLWIVIHALALESGLMPLQGSDSYSMPENWRQSAFYNIKYHLPESEEVVCSITGVVMGSFLVVHGAIVGREDDDSCMFKSVIKPKEFVKENTQNGAAQCYQNLRQISRTIKNQICLPLLQEMRTVLGYPAGVHLISLTHELKLKILGYLDCASLLRLDQTCHHFHCLARDKAVWRRRYLLDFGSRNDNNLSQNWYEMYKCQYTVRKEHRKAMKEWTLLTPGQVWMQPRPHSPWSPMAPYNGGILGGDYDLNPQFQGIPDPLGRHGNNPLQPFMPRPRIDPFGPLPDHNIIPGPRRGRRGGGGGWMGGFGGPRMF